MKSKIAYLSMTLLSTTTAVQAQQNISYVASGTREQVLDLYWPQSKPSATVIFIHGGSLQESGERRTSPMYRNVCVQFVARGIACATIDYRLAPSHKWPTMPNDVASAVAHIRKTLTARGADPKRIFLFGHSSGCHLAAIVGTNPIYLHSAGLQPDAVAGVIAMGCLLDRDDTAIRKLTADRIRAPFNREPQDVATYGTPENYLAANPASFVSDKSAPTLVIAAEAERFMPPIVEQGARFVRLLLEHNIPANMLIVPGTHVSSIQSVSKPDDPALAAILRFIANPAASAAAH